MTDSKKPCQTKRWIDRQIEHQKDGWIEQQTDKRIDRLKDEWTE